MTVVSRYRTIVVETDDTATSEILKSYAEFWTIPWQTRAEPNEQHTIFSTGKTIVPKTGATVVCSLFGKESAGKIAKDHGLALSLREASITLPASRDADVSLKTGIYEF